MKASEIASVTTQERWIRYEWIYLFSVISVLLCKSANSQDLGRFKEWRERALMHVNFAVVNEFHEGM